MLKGNDINWRSSRPRRHIARWVVGLGGVVAVLAYLNGGMPSEPDIRLPPKLAPTAAPATQPVHKAEVVPRAEPVRVLNPAPQPAPHMQTDARPSPRARSDYQELRRELLSTD
jgi:hypothetical protein